MISQLCHSNTLASTLPYRAWYQVSLFDYHLVRQSNRNQSQGLVHIHCWFEIFILHFLIEK
jgi:hypothetical protein